ncbi:Y-family DNA polymerase [Bacillus alkalicellulosilyticus]|uniref:Y-family DNA polymerase n=1 Tax=Alkalihalobacterium alkalicellulosilyticum TaxID=1912214 RepID=UPI00148386B6|nr:DNA polymerase IV [Bacillus alkalicellulosilyticus]
MLTEKTILLADMNSFFASCHQSQDPSLRNKPIIVGGSPTDKRKGMVIAASYEARNKGVFTTMSVFEALKKCPEAIVVKRDHPLYSAYSQKIMDFLRLIGDTEVASVDEAYVDITPHVKEGKNPISIAKYIQKTLWDKIQIPCSIGIGENRIIAKMGADVRKPFGVTALGRIQFCSYFHPQPLHVLHGCGKKTEEKLNKQGIKTIGELAMADPLHLKMLLGLRGQFLQQAALGASSDRVDADRRKGDKTIGKEKTFSQPTFDQDMILSIGKNMVEHLIDRLTKKELRAKTISIVYKLERTGGSHTKNKTLPEATRDADTIYNTVSTLFEDHLVETPLWLFGVRLSNFENVTYEQLKLF